MLCFCVFLFRFLRALEDLRREPNESVDEHLEKWRWGWWWKVVWADLNFASPPRRQRRHPETSYGYRASVSELDGVARFWRRWWQRVLRWRQVRPVVVREGVHAARTILWAGATVARSQSECREHSDSVYCWVCIVELFKRIYLFPKSNLWGSEKKF